MRIVMTTNSYAPHVSGIARSVEAFAIEYRERKVTLQRPTELAALAEGTA
jgi:hypothetical protein